MTVVKYPPSLFDLFISFFSLIGRKSKIYKRTHEANKKVALSSTFLRTVFSAWADLFFDDPACYAHA